MKLALTWKDPDYFDNAPQHIELTEDDWRTLRDMGIGQYLTLDIDTDAKTAVVRRPKSRRLPIINGDSRP